MVLLYPSYNTVFELAVLYGTYKYACNMQLTHYKTSQMTLTFIVQWFASWLADFMYSALYPQFYNMCWVV